MTAALIALIGALFVAPFVWSILVALARRAAIGSRDDAHEKSILALMLAPLGLGAVLLVLPGESVSAVAPPLLDWVELPAQVAVGAGGGHASGAAPLDWLLITALTLLVIYALGVVRYATPLIKAHLRLHRWVRAAQASESLIVHVSDHAQTPIAVSNKRILFPRHLLDALSAEQVRLIIAHECHHHARGDVAFYALLAWIDVAFWFNPFVRGQTQHCRLAAELECDAAVTAASPDMRRAYAQTLLVVLTHSAGYATPCAPAVFSHRALGENRMRILQIMKNDAPRKRAPWFAYVAACALAAPLGIVQLALAQSGNEPFVLTAPSPISALSSDAVMPDRSIFTHRPLEGRLVGTYGQRIDPQTGEPTFHPGVDIEAPFGTRVFAPADGRVIRAVEHPEYGSLIEIDHGDGLATRYAHLSAFDVRDGDAVQPGQVIGRVGNSGRSTRTQLHIEVWRRDRAWDPSMVLDLPAAD